MLVPFTESSGTTFTEMEEEIWKPIVGYEGRYEVSNTARVKSLNYRGTGKNVILKQYEHVRGKYYKSVYHSVCLCSGRGKPIRKYVHVLVATAFIPNPEGKPAVDHIFGTQYGDVVENLRWVWPKENTNNKITLRHIKAATPKMVGADNKKSKKVHQYDMNGNKIGIFNSIMEANSITGVNRTCVSAVCLGKRKTAGGYIWKYADKNKA